MSHQYAPPSSLRLELEAQRMYATARAAPLGETAPALIFSRFPLAFDAFVWAAAAVFVFPHQLFPDIGQTAGVLSGLLLWSLAYAAQPLGRKLFSEVSHRHGRGVGLTAARILLGALTAAFALMTVSPGVSAIALLAGCRLLQGLAMGGVSTRGVARSEGGVAIVVLAGLVGLVAAGGLFGGLRAVLSPADFLDWGWRYPFVLGVPVNTVALFADLRLLATDGGEGTSKSSLLRLATERGAPVRDESQARPDR